MKVALIADPEIPVPPILYGGIERVIDLLVKGLTKKGIEVSLFAHKDSDIKAKLFPYNDNSVKLIRDVNNSFLINKSIIGKQYDIIHSFGRLAYLLPQLPLNIPKIMSYQREPTIAQIKKAVKLSKKNTLYFTGCSAYIANQIKPFAPAFAVFNGVELETYDFNPSSNVDAHLIFLGRIEPIKGTHIAIEVAKRTNKKLIIAGNVPNEYQSYFKENIEPHLNENIKYVGPVNDIQKNELLGHAAALLMPIDWNEPFGIVMAEAMACGTPVIAFNKGSVPEVVNDRLNGFICNSIQEMVDAVGRINELDRSKVRKDCEVRFSAEVIVNEYIKIYEHVQAKKHNS